MILSATLSKPNSNVEEILGKAYIKIKIKAVSATVVSTNKPTLSSTGWKNAGNSEQSYYMEMFTEKQAFHKHITESELNDFLVEHAGKTFRNCVERTESEEITILGSKKGKITLLVKKLNQSNSKPIILGNPSDKKKNYLIPEGKPVPFLILLGVMTDDGKIISSKYDKFRQINRFLEFVNDVLPEVTKDISPADGYSRPVRIADFGCGKSYLTFAVHYFLTEIKQIPCEIEGLDLKQDVIDYCNQTAQKLGCKNLVFKTGDIAQYSSDKNPDIIITLHACDTATDYALKYAVERNCKAILSVPCCQHQINQQIKTNEADDNFSSLLKWGIIKEKFSSLVTDALRGEWLEQQGYKVQMLEFIDMEHTPKNILIRAVKNENKKNISQNGTQGTDPEGILNLPKLIDALKINPEIFK